MAGKDLKGIVERIVDLPTLPQVVTQIMTMIEDPNSSAKDINNIMSNDPALVGKILKLVNSAFYALPNKVSSIQQAITILGFHTIKSLAISASVFDLFGDGGEDFSYEDFWTYSLGCATISTFLAKRERGLNHDTAFVIGLLHGMGKLVLNQYAPVEFHQIVVSAKEKRVSFVEAEKEFLETSYADIGYWLAKKWQLAEEVQLAIQHQEHLLDCPEEYRLLGAILIFARYVCRVKGYGASGDFDKPSLPRAAWDCLHIRKEDLPAVIGQINEEMQRAEGFLSVIHS